MSNKAKGIFFDAGDTLFQVKEGVGVQYSRFAKKYGIDVAPDLLNQRFREVFKRSPPLAFPGLSGAALKAREKEWWYRIVRAVFDDIRFPKFDPLFEEIFHFFRGAEGWVLFPDTKETLDRLSKEGYPLGIISNFDSRIEEVCSALGIRRYFQTVTISSQEGVAKPSPEIFKKALKKAGLLPTESLYIGDSPDHDIKGAQEIGMKVLLLDRTGRYPNERAVPRISSLQALADHLW
ncbi:MAG: HAD-IA family hydrolase [Nitrospirae bacterium]|nr:HAD-IA family hydrolase [Candidatus Manganitrophaceae bacterium]